MFHKLEPWQPSRCWANWLPPIKEKDPPTPSSSPLSHPSPFLPNSFFHSSCRKLLFSSCSIQKKLFQFITSILGYPRSLSANSDDIFQLLPPYLSFMSEHLKPSNYSMLLLFPWWHFQQHYSNLSHFLYERSLRECNWEEPSTWNW